jgi:hypothetical protein
VDAHLCHLKSQMGLDLILVDPFFLFQRIIRT